MIKLFAFTFDIQDKRKNYYNFFFFLFVVRLAKLVADEVLTAPCDTSVLYPKTGGNLHCFTAVTPCAVLDILTPPYREDAGRISTYYHDYPYAAFGK